MKILVCGGRTFGEYLDGKPKAQTDEEQQLLFETLFTLHSATPITCVVHGAAKGADMLAAYWAERGGVNHRPYPADWTKYGKSAGPRRNAHMLDDNPDIELVVAFPGGKGTEGMIRLAKAAGIEVLKVGGVE